MSSSEGTYHTAENRSRAQSPDHGGTSSQHDLNPQPIASFLETFVPRHCPRHGITEDSRRSTPRLSGWGQRNRDGNDETMWFDVQGSCQNRRNGMDGGNDHGSHNMGGTTNEANEMRTAVLDFPSRGATNPAQNGRFHGGNSGTNGQGFRASNGRVQHRGPTQNPNWGHAHARQKKRHQNAKHHRGGNRSSGRQQPGGQASSLNHRQQGRGSGRNRSGRIARPHRNGVSTLNSSSMNNSGKLGSREMKGFVAKIQGHPNLNNYNDRQGAVQETLRPFLPWPEYFDDNEAVPSTEFIRPVQYPRANYQSERLHENNRAPQPVVNFYSDRQFQDAGGFSGGISTRVETNRNVAVQGPRPYQHGGVRPQRSAGYRSARTREIPIVNPRSGLPIRREEVRRSTVRRNPGVPGAEGIHRGQGIRFGSFELVHRPAIRTGGLNPLAPAFTPSSSRPEINVLVELQVQSNLSTGLTAEEFSSIKDVFVGVDIPLEDLRQILHEECLCAICCSPMEDGDHVKQLPCSDVHIFHSKCIWRWTQNAPTCPLCRQNLREKVQTASPSPVEQNRDLVNGAVEVPALSMPRNRTPLARQVAGEFRDQIHQLHLLGEELANDLREGIEEDLTQLVLDQLDEHLDGEEEISGPAGEPPQAGWSSEMAMSRRWIQVENEGQDPLSPADSLDILRRQRSAPPSHINLIHQGSVAPQENQQEGYFTLTQENLLEFGSPDNARGRLIGRYLDNLSELQRQHNRPLGRDNAELGLTQPPTASRTRSPIPSINSEEIAESRTQWSPSIQFLVSAQANRTTHE